jgi:23S rRNA pseudouridine1911/1915/1917 synthase
VSAETEAGALRLRLAALFPEASGRSVKRWLAEGRVRVNDGVVRDPRRIVTEHDTVRLGPPSAPPGPRDLPGGVRVIHEDEHVVVIDKPPGLLTIATPRQRVRTAYRIVRTHVATRRPPGRVFIVHRLDRDTSGLIVLARTPAAKQQLQRQFAAGRVKRVYLAVVHGVVAAEEDTLESRLVETRSLQVRSLTGGARPGSLPVSSGRRAVAHYRVQERGRATTLLEVTLGTGRRRQIRVQLADLGHPIVGDRDHDARRTSMETRPAGALIGRAGSRRLLLHAMRLGFLHPATGEAVRFESPPPAGFWHPAPRASPVTPDRRTPSPSPRRPAHGAPARATEV